MIASGFKWVGKVSENPFVVVMNERSLAMHYLSRVNYFPPKRLTDAAKIKGAEISKKLKGVIQALGTGRTAEIDDWEYEKNLEEESYR